jgi:hypothetical protein
MKIIAILLFASLSGAAGYAAGVVPQADASQHKPCIDPTAVPAAEGDAAAFKSMLLALHVDMAITLYTSDDQVAKDHGGAMSFKCSVTNEDFYEEFENWTIFDPDLIKGDAARDFVFAHEIAHHLNGDTFSPGPASKKLELRADFNGAHFLMQMGWNKARLMHALDLLNLPQGPQPGYPTAEERRANVEKAAEPPVPGAPTNLRAFVVPEKNSFDKEMLSLLVNLKLPGPVRLQSVRTSKYVCSVGTADSKVVSTRHFAFFDNCNQGPLAVFDLRVGPPGEQGYWIQQYEKPCPDYAGYCGYALQFVGHQLQFWNQNLAADQSGWEKELGDEELFSFELSGPSSDKVRMKDHQGGYIFVDPQTAQLEAGGTQAQAAEFRLERGPD